MSELFLSDEQEMELLRLIRKDGSDYQALRESHDRLLAALKSAKEDLKACKDTVYDSCDTFYYGTLPDTDEKYEAERTTLDKCETIDYYIFKADEAITAAEKIVSNR